MTVIDVHTHMCSEGYMAALAKHGGPHYSVGEIMGGQRGVLRNGVPFMTLTKPMFDYALRISDMDAAGVDVAVVSLSVCNVYWGGEEVSAATARGENESMAAAQTAYPDRIRWFASLPWQYPEPAVAELERAMAAGAAGVMVLANVAGRHLTDPLFDPVWAAIDAHGVPVLVHPTVPPGGAEMEIERFNLAASVGFMFDTTLAIGRMIFDGFFERYRELKIIAAHAGGALPFIAGRLDMCYENMPAAREKISRAPSTYLREIYYDSVTFQQESLEVCVSVAGPDNVLYGSDYPHNIGDMKGCLARVDNLSGATREAVRGGNAQRIFKF